MTIGVSHLEILIKKCAVHIERVILIDVRPLLISSRSREFSHGYEGYLFHPVHLSIGLRIITCKRASSA